MLHGLSAYANIQSLIILEASRRKFVLIKNTKFKTSAETLVLSLLS